MAYTPTNWVTGDTVTATKMNKLEQGVANAGGGGLVTVTSDTLDKTYNEISAMVSQGIIPFIVNDNGYIYSLFWYSDDDGYNATFGYFNPNDKEFLANAYFSSTADGQMVLD